MEVRVATTQSTSSSPPGAGKYPRRGRREKPWPPSKQRKLLRLYVCTQSERLPLVRILERLKDGTFDPRQRNSHKHLKNLLPDRRIDDWRPRDLASMLVRVRFLRSVRAERRMRRKNRDHRARGGNTNQHHAAADIEWRSPTGYLGSRMGVGMMDRGAMDTDIIMNLDGNPLRNNQHIRHHRGRHDSAQSSPQALLSESATASPETSHASHASCQLHQSPINSPETSHTSHGAPSHRERSPVRSEKSMSSSLKSASESLRSAFKRRSWASVLSSISSGISSLARSSSSASSKGVGHSENGPTVALSKLSRDDFLSLLEENKPLASATKAKVAKALQNPLFKKKYSSVNPKTEELNNALLAMCCSAHIETSSPPCVHERLSKAIEAQDSEGHAFRKFTVTDEEANMADKYGNILLHVAARWGARVSILLLLLRHTDDIQAVNVRGETFLHVYEPPSHPKLRPASFINLVRHLRSRGFDFCQRDVEKRTFLQHLVPKKTFPIEILHCLFREVGHGTARFLVANKCSADERLWHCIRKNLSYQSPKLHRIFGDEQEFVRRYLPEFMGDSSCNNSTRITMTSDSDSWRGSSSRGSTASSSQSIKRTPVMRLLCKIASGRDSDKHGGEANLDQRLEALLGIGPKTTKQDIEAWLNERDTEGNSALHYAAEFGIVAAVKFITSHGAQVNVMNNCGNTPLQLIKYAIQRTDVRTDVYMEARYLRCAVLLLERGAFDQSKLVSERSVIYPYDVFDGSERCITNLVKQGVAYECRGLHLLSSSIAPHGPAMWMDENGHMQFAQHSYDEEGGNGEGSGHAHGHGHGGYGMHGMPIGAGGMPMHLEFQTSFLG
ncbi:uncharacterized protein B0T23DRAFT_103339 [Neurospora hispaniola]|uniref:Ankyrin n=1 Tax=Neurospora hispaniola TaxID=588809 RepID=A0AAJ0MS56_9PEZI|nr:hypothetical protein B0T23DRAFT_103339 [Neurospora hispaniola]